MPTDPISGLTDSENKYLLAHPAVHLANGATVFTDDRARALAVQGAANTCSWMVSTKDGNVALTAIIGCIAMIAIPFGKSLKSHGKARSIPFQSHASAA